MSATIEQLETRIVLSAGQQVFSFGDHGILVPASGQGEIPQSVAAQADGKIIVRLTTAKGGNQLERFSADGETDSTFGDNGSATIPPKMAGAGKILTDHAGNIIVAAGSAIVRFDSQGKLDGNFSNGGIDSTGFTKITSAVMRGDGRIVVGGGDVVQQFRANGSADRSFGTNGNGAINLQSATKLDHISIIDLARQSDGAVIVLASVTDGDNARPIVIRLHSNLTLDRSFAAANNYVLADLAGNFAQSLAVDGQDRIVVAEKSEQNFSDAKLIRLMPDGAFDGSFGDAGMIDVPQRLNDQSGGTIRALTDSSDKIILADTARNNFGDTIFGFERFTADGSPDLTFSIDSMSSVDFPGEVEKSRLADAALTPDGRIIAVGGTARAEFTEIDTHGADTSVASLSKTGVLTIPGTPGNDVIEVDRDRDTFEGTDFIDVLFDGDTQSFKTASVRQIVVDAGAGDDAINVTTVRPTTVLGGAGDDVISIIHSHDSVQLNLLDGGAGNDSITGYFGHDILHGDAGNDTLIGGLGGDILNGGSGTDTADRDTLDTDTSIENFQ